MVINIFTFYPIILAKSDLIFVEGNKKARLTKSGFFRERRFMIGVGFPYTLTSISLVHVKTINTF